MIFILTTITTQANPITTQANLQSYYLYGMLYININIYGKNITVNHIQ